MDRRDFFQTIFITPLLTPFLLASQASKKDVLYLIDNHPESVLPPLLKEVEKWSPALDRSYSFHDEHPQKEEIGRVLRRCGWTPASFSGKASLILSFRPLGSPALPSFTLVRSGKIWDIRSSQLRSLWKEMNRQHAPSAVLTILSFQADSSNLPCGDSVRIFRSGEKFEELSLKKNQDRIFKVSRGTISIRIQSGKIWVPDSSCPQKICCSTPPISRVGERIVCAPNHFLLEVSGPKLVDTIIG